jgi:hypothetical protein
LGLRQTKSEAANNARICKKAAFTLSPEGDSPLR